MSKIKMLNKIKFSPKSLVAYILVFGLIGSLLLYKGSAFQSPSNIVTSVGEVFGAYSSSVQIGSDSLPVMAVAEGGILSVVHCSVINCSSYTVQTVAFNNVADQGNYVYMAIGNDGLPIVSFDNDATHDLNILHCGNVTCTSGNLITPITTLDSDGQTSKTIIGSDHLPVVIYNDATTNDVAVLHCGNAACSSGNTNTILSTPNIDGQNYTTITIASDGLPVLGYPDETTGDIGVTKCGNLACTSGNTSVDISAAKGVYPSMFTASDGLPVMSYTATSGATSHDLGIIKCGNSACSAGNTVTTIPTPDDDGYFARLIMQGDGKPLIVHHNQTRRDIFVVKCANSACSSVSNNTEITDPDKIGNTLSVKNGTDGNPIVAYPDNDGFYLKILHCATPDCSDSTSPTPILGDFNGDSHVTIIDLSILLSNYGKAGTASTGDANNDGAVSLIDLSIVLTNYGK